MYCCLLLQIYLCYLWLLLCSRNTYIIVVISYDFRGCCLGLFCCFRTKQRSPHEERWEEAESVRSDHQSQVMMEKNEPDISPSSPSPSVLQPVSPARSSSPNTARDAESRTDAVEPEASAAETPPDGAPPPPPSRPTSRSSAWLTASLRCLRSPCWPACACPCCLHPSCRRTASSAGEARLQP